MAQEENNQSTTIRPNLAELGGEEGVIRWVDCFYDKIAADRRLSALFTRDITLSKKKQSAYFIEFFGGEPHYTQAYGKPFLRYKHRHVKIGAQERDAWLELNFAAMLEVGIDKALANRVLGILTPIAEEMVNHHPHKKDAYYFNP